jgi:hypothetical protein
MGFGKGGGGGGGKKPGKGDDPSKGHYFAAGGDVSSLLWNYSTRKTKEYLLEWRSFPSPLLLASTLT